MILIENSRFKRIVNLSVPIVVGMLAVNLMGLIDTAMVGQLGDSSLAGVGTGSYLFFLLVSILLGLGSGVQAMVARRIGEGNLELTGLALNAGLLISIVVSVVLIILGYLCFPYLYPIVNQDPQVIQKGWAYLMTRLPSILFIGISLPIRSYWIGVSLAKWSMVSILMMTMCNILFNYVLIFGNFGFPRLETAGAGLGTTLATSVSMLVNIGLALKYARKNGFLRGLPEKERIQTLIKVSLPDSLRQFLFVLGLVVSYTIVGLMGTKNLAAFHVILSIMLIAILPANGMGQAATTLVSESLGNKEPNDAKRWGWEVARVGTGVLSLFSAGMLFFPQFILALFIVDETTIQIAKLPLQLVGLSIWIESFGRILSFALVGAGATKTVMILSLILQWGLFLPLNWFIGVHLGYGLVGVFTNSFFSFTLGTIVFSYIWYRGQWSHIKL